MMRRNFATTPTRRACQDREPASNPDDGARRACARHHARRRHNRRAAGIDAARRGAVALAAALALAPQDTISRKYVAMSLGQLGRTRDTQIEIAELVKRQTDASIALFQQQGFRHKWMRELHVEGLRKAGLQEK